MSSVSESSSSVVGTTGVSLSNSSEVSRSTSPESLSVSCEVELESFGVLGSERTPLEYFLNAGEKVNNTFNFSGMTLSITPFFGGIFANPLSNFSGLHCPRNSSGELGCLTNSGETIFSSNLIGLGEGVRLKARLVVTVITCGDLSLIALLFSALSALAIY